MLSILITTKDYDCRQLVHELHRQGEALALPFEILVGEDGTSAANLQKNITIEELQFCRRIIREKNVGRANMRNILGIEAKYPYLLFIDSDAVIEKPDFLACYIDAARDYEVVCGGLYHADTLKDKECTLRYKYEKRADKRRDAATRNQKPYDCFSTFNFLIRRELFLSIFFNSNITKYGYEDTLFGKELERRGATIMHIENRLLHNGLESNEVYIHKIEQSISTLVSIEKELGPTPLLRTAHRLRRWHMTWFFTAAWKACNRLITKNLYGKHPSLTLFNIHKLGLYFSIKRRA